MLNAELLQKIQKKCKDCYIGKYDNDGYVCGSLYTEKQKQGNFRQAIIELRKKNPDGTEKRAQKWIALGLKERGTKTQAEEMLFEIRKYVTEYIHARDQQFLGSSALVYDNKSKRFAADSENFADYILTFHKEEYAKVKSRKLLLTTYAPQEGRLNAVVLPYFKSTGLKLHP